MTGWEAFWLGFHLIGGTLLLHMAFFDYVFRTEKPGWIIWYVFLGVISLTNGIVTLVSLVR